MKKLGVCTQSSLCFCLMNLPVEQKKEKTRLFSPHMM